MPGHDHFILERYLKGEIVHYDLPLYDAAISLELNSEIVITGALSADFVSKADSGMGLFPYNDCIHWVRDGVLKGGALLQPLAFDESGNVIISARGWSTMLDVPIINGFIGNGNHTVQNAISALLTETNDNVLGGHVGFFWEFLGPLAPPLGTVSPLQSASPAHIEMDSPPGSGGEGSIPWSGSTGGGGGTGSLGGWDAGSGGSSGGSSGSSGSIGGAFSGPPNRDNTGVVGKGSNHNHLIFMPWEAANVLEELRSLCEATPYDIEEFEEWDGDTNNIKKTLKLHHPRMGKPRHDLRFVEGENILQSFSTSTSAEDYANAVMVIGAGEGPDTVVVYKYLEITNTARRVHVIDDQSIYNVKIANSIANLELAQRSQAIHIGSILVDIDHPNAPLDELKVGDDIKVDATIPFLGRQVVWHRITGISYAPGGSSAELSLSRSDSFNYLFNSGE